MRSIRREVDADNSCLFSSIAYLIDKNNFNGESGLIFRQIIIDYLQDNLFDVTLLDQSKDKYIEFIQNPKNWGGALEIKMFSEIFKKKIICFDIRTNRIDIYGEDKNYHQCVYLIYTGIHYDPIIMNIDDNSDPSTDITIFNSNDMDVFEIMKSLLVENKNVDNYLNFYSLVCSECAKKFINENEALEHSINYNHWNFQEQ